MFLFDFTGTRQCSVVEAVFNVSAPTSNWNRALSLGVSTQGDVTPSGVYCSVHDVLQLKVYWAEEQLCLVRGFRLPLRCRFLLGFLSLLGETDRLIRNVCTELTILRCVTSQNSSDFNCVLCVRFANIYQRISGVKSNLDRR